MQWSKRLGAREFWAVALWVSIPLSAASQLAQEIDENAPANPCTALVSRLPIELAPSGSYELPYGARIWGKMPMVRDSPWSAA